MSMCRTLNLRKTPDVSNAARATGKFMEKSHLLVPRTLLPNCHASRPAFVLMNSSLSLRSKSHHIA